MCVSELRVLVALLVATAAAPAFSEPTVVSAKAYLDVDRGRLVEPAVIVIEKGVIAAVNPSSIPSGERVDLAGLTLLPGLIDTHTHLTYEVDRGWVDGPRMQVSGHALSITGGHCDVTGFAPGVKELDYRSGIADGVDEVVKAVRYQIKHGATVIKICATAGVLSFEGPVGAQQ
jgi:imidazolonepropionase-like amidohydrolase